MRIPELLGLIVVFGLVLSALSDEQLPKEDNETMEGKEVAMPVTLKWLGHASFRISHGDTVIYIDPWKIDESPKDATLVLVSHSHGDHYSAEDIARISGPKTKLIASEDVVEKEGKGQAIAPGDTVEAAGVKIEAIASYNPNKRFHPKANNWVGFVVNIGGKRIYYAGDTDITDEMKALENIDLALLPVGGKYTMNAEEAAEAVSHFKPEQAVPYHYGDIIGEKSDAENFAEKADCEVTVLSPGESLEL